MYSADLPVSLPMILLRVQNIQRIIGTKKTLIKHDATLGANCTIVCGNTVGEYAMVAAGAVVTKSVRPYALVAGVPAREIGWVCECGQVLDDAFICPDCGRDHKNIAEGGESPGGYWLKKAA